MDLLSKFLKISMSYFSEVVDVEQRLEKIVQLLKGRQVNGQFFQIYDPDPLDFSILFLYLIDHGAHPICIANTQFSNPEFKSIINKEYKEQIIQSAKKPYPFPAYSIQTSGSTGIPKICDFSLEKAFQNSDAHAKAFGITSEFAIIQTLPVHHSYGIIAYILTPLLLNCSLHYFPGIIGLKSIVKKLRHNKAVIHVSPAQARLFLKENISELQNISKITIGGGSFKIRELIELKNKFPSVEFYVSYGLTEAGPRVTAGHWKQEMKDLYQFQSDDSWIGEPLQHVDCKIEHNILVLKSPYLKLNIEASEMTVDGYFITRDFVQNKLNQYIFLSRAEDLIKVGGISLYPKDFEEIIRQWPEVTDCIILKKADQLYEEIIFLFIETNLDLETVQNRLSKQSDLYYLIREIYLLNKFPRTSLDKIDREELRKLYFSNSPN